MRFISCPPNGWKIEIGQNQVLMRCGGMELQVGEWVTSTSWGESGTHRPPHCWNSLQCQRVCELRCLYSKGVCSRELATPWTGRCKQPIALKEVPCHQHQRTSKTFPVPVHQWGSGMGSLMSAAAILPTHSHSPGRPSQSEWGYLGNDTAGFGGTRTSLWLSWTTCCGAPAAVLKGHLSCLMVGGETPWWTVTSGHSSIIWPGGEWAHQPQPSLGQVLRSLRKGWAAAMQQSCPLTLRNMVRS